MAQLDAVLAVSSELISEVMDSPLASSPMGVAYRKMLRDPYEQSGLLLMSAEDHLRTVLAILQGNLLPMFSVYTLLRPAAEADVRMRYLLDSTIGEKERLGRGLSVRFETLREQSKVRPDRAHFAQRLAQIEKKATDNGIATVRSSPKKGGPEVIGFGEALKNEVDLFRTYHAGGELLYRVLSSHIHARPWAWMDPQKAVPTAEPGVSQVKAELDIPLFTHLLALTLKTHVNALVRLLELAGRTRGEWENAKQAALDRVGPRYLALLSPAAPGA
ncbi:MAG: hypothetical protein ACRDF0_05205 [Candidatus Limnocylindria bacterium]